MYLPIDTPINWDDLLTRFEWLRALSDCPQDPIFHAEGDVLTHTRMVADALLTRTDWSSLADVTQTALFWSALLHDVAKPVCTREEDGRITSPGHAQKGAQWVQRLLYHEWPADLPPVPFALRQQIAALVRYHGLPLWFWDKPDMVRAVVTASQFTRCRDIAQLAEADVLGRVCADQRDLLDRIELFREFCMETDCLDRPRAFASDHSRFLYFRNPSQHPDYAAYDDTRFEVTLMSGLPGVGKDTWLQNHAPDMRVIALDDLRKELGIGPTDNQGPVIAQAKECARDYLRAEQPFVWNATNLSRQMRAPLIDLFVSYGARVRIVYLEVPWAEILHRNQTRQAAVPINALHKMANQLEVPDITEAQRVEWQITTS